MVTKMPVVAIVGRQNVGKSTLVNRLVKKPLAIVDNSPGTTRDRIMAIVSFRDSEFIVVDTGGIETNPESEISRVVNQQVRAALDDCDVIIFLLDAREGVLPDDIEIAEMLRKTGKPVVLVGNKVDNKAYERELVDFYQLGLGEPLGISAYHNLGIYDMLDKVTHLLPGDGRTDIIEDTDSLKVAIIGRPNVGKSTLLNAIVGSERAIVDNIPGTTRDSIDTMFDYNGTSMLLIDTGGIRRRGRIKTGVERYSVIRAMRAIDRADINLLILDATEMITAQDMHLAGYMQHACKGIVLLINKWDVVRQESTAEIEGYIKRCFKFITYAPVQYISAKTGWGVSQIMPLVQRIYAERLKRIPTASVNDVIQRAVNSHGLPRKGRQKLKVLYTTQAQVNPPTFVFFVNCPDLVHFSFQRYLENSIRKAFGFNGTAIKLIFRSRET
ncbi:MAG: ribosome biogenesis GTPase Der [Dehalococcoidales bacterium]